MGALLTEDILDFQVACEGVGKCIDSIMDWIAEGETCRWLACINPHSYVVSLNDPVFFDALHSADWLIPDGTGIVLASRLQGGSISKRITGSDVFFKVHQKLNRTGGSVFFLGSTEGTLAEICARMAVDHPNVRVSGTHSPPFKPAYSVEENHAMIDNINAVSPDVLWVGMTAPKQEKWIFEHSDKLQVKFAGAVGAVFEFYTGRVKRSHPVFQHLGLEWLPRMIQEPRRLWRRNFVSSPLFLFKVINMILKRNNLMSRNH